MSHSPARPSKREVVTAFRHAEILDAARRVFAARGFEGACMDDIARHAGMAKGTIYLYYPSKQEVYRAALREGLEALLDQLRRSVGSAQGARQKIRAFIQTKLAFLERHREFLGIYNAGLAQVPLPLHLQKDYKDYYVKQLSLLETALAERGRRAGTRRLPARVVAQAVADLTGGILRRRLQERSREGTRQDAEAVLDLVWNGLAAR
jgi:AcrR family transcriptional regulator